MLLSNLLIPQRIRVPLSATDKSGALRALVEIVAGGTDATADGLMRSVEEREQLLSTGIGHGVAIPHGKSDAVNELRVAAGVTAAPIAFDALDGNPVRLIFLLVGPESASGEHVRALSRISRIVREASVREALIAAKGPDDFYRLLRDAEIQ